jgi:hypothetical protein
VLPDGFPNADGALTYLFLLGQGACHQAVIIIRCFRVAEESKYVSEYLAVGLYQPFLLRLEPDQKPALLIRLDNGTP